MGTPRPRMIEAAAPFVVLQAFVPPARSLATEWSSPSHPTTAMPTSSSVCARRSCLVLHPTCRSSISRHDIPAHDVRAGALLLVRAVQYLPEDSIVVAVVDPGVGTDRRLVAVEVEGGVLLGPDNGLLAPAVAMIGGATRRRRAHQSRLPASRAGSHVRRARRARAGGRSSGSRRRARRPRTAGRSRGARPRARVAPRDARGRRHRRGGLVGRPVRELPAQHRPGRARSGRHPARRSGRGAAATAKCAPPGGCTPTPTPSRRSWSCWSTPTDCSSLALDRESAAAALGIKAGSGVTLVPEGASLSLTIGHHEP